MKTIGDIIKEKRKAKGWNQSKLAKVTGYAVTTLQGWESGNHEPRACALADLADAFGCSLDELVGREPPRVPLTVETLDPVIAEIMDTFVKYADMNCNFCKYLNTAQCCFQYNEKGESIEVIPVGDHCLEGVLAYFEKKLEAQK